MFKLTHTITLKPALIGALCMISACGISPHSTSQSTAPLSQKEKNLIQLAKASEDGRDFSQSISLYKQAVDMADGNVEAHMALANLYDRKGMRDKALDMMKQAKKEQPYHPTVNEQLGTYYAKQGDSVRAMSYFDDGLKANPDDAILLNGKGLALDMAGNHAQAQAAYQHGLIRPLGNKDELLNNLGVSFMMTGNYDKAIANMTGIDPKGTAIRKNLAVAYSLKGDAKQSKKWRGKDISAAAVNDSATFYRNYLARF